MKDYERVFKSKSLCKICTKQVMLQMLKQKMLRFLSKFHSFIKLPKQKINISKTWLCHFLVLLRNTFMQKIKNRPTEQFLRKMRHRWMY